MKHVRALSVRRISCACSMNTVYVMTAHCGSRFADTAEKIQQIQPNATVIRGAAVSGFDPDSSETEVREFVRSTIK